MPLFFSNKWNSTKIEFYSTISTLLLNSHFLSFSFSSFLSFIFVPFISFTLSLFLSLFHSLAYYHSSSLLSPSLNFFSNSLVLFFTYSLLHSSLLFLHFPYFLFSLSSSLFLRFSIYFFLSCFSYVYIKRDILLSVQCSKTSCMKAYISQQRCRTLKILGTIKLQ